MATSTSHYVKTVCLKDWWLIKADNNSQHNTLAVAGIESIGQPAARVFISAPIAKRLYFCTLQTADGVFVSLKGPINKERTCENGFSEEVFKYFFIGFPSNWENCIEKCFQQGIGSEATADADLNSANANPWKDEHSKNTPEHFTDEAQEEINDLHDDRNTEIDEEWSFRDARSDAQNHDKDRHSTVNGHDADACVNDDKHDSDVGFREEVVRYSLRNRKVPYFEGKRAFKVKHVKNLSKTKPLSKKTMESTHTSTRPLVASLKDSQSPGMAPLCEENLKENSKRPDFAITGEVNDANHAENIAARRSLSGEALSVGNSMHRIKKPHKSHKGDVMAPILQDASKANNLISHHSSVGKSRESKKGKRIERRTSQKNMVSTGSLLKKTGEVNDANHAENIAARRSLSGEALSVGNSMHRIKKPHKSHKGDVMAPILQDASKANNLISHHSSVGKSRESKKGKRIERRTSQKNMVSTGSLLKKTGEVNDANHAENIAARRSLSGEALSVGNSMHRIKKPHKSHKGDVMAPILQDASKANNLISHHSSVGKSRESKKGKRIERRTSQKNMASTGSLLKKTGERTDAFATTPVTELPAQGNFAKSGVVEARGNNTENQNVRGEDESMQTLDHIRLASVTKKQSICKASKLVETNIEFSPQVVEKVVNATHGSKKEGKQRSILTCHVSARPTPNSRGSMPNLQSRRELDYAEKKTCTTEEETPSSQRSVIKTSRSGRLLLPTMEFWRNQLPIYDADHGLCGIKEGSTIMKLERDEAF